MYDTARRSGGVARQQCRWCSVEKPVGEFWRNPDTGWITRECRTCAEERLRLWAAVEQAPVATTRRYVDEANELLRCTRCGRHLPRTAFYTYSDGRSERRYYRPKCRQCMGAEQNRSKPEYRARPERRRTERDRWLRKTYGISLVEYEALLLAQSGRCAICGTDAPGGPTPESAFHVDHDHASGRVRGLLCRACNTALGLFEEDAARLRAAERYLSL